MVSVLAVLEAAVIERRNEASPQPAAASVSASQHGGEPHRGARPGTVLVVDDHPMLRWGMAQLLATDAALELVGQVDSPCQALALAQERRPDLILLGLNMKGGGELLRALKADDPARRVVILTTAEATEALIEAIRMGASGYLSVDIEPDALLVQVKAALRGDTVVCDALAAALASALREEPIPGAGERSDLTGREQDVLRGVAAGMSNQMIADELVISIGTVKVHIKHILKKLGFRSRLEAAVWALKRGYKLAR
ncbi:MAG: response regulator [Burkholderiaceae bacterium]